MKGNEESKGKDEKNFYYFVPGYLSLSEQLGKHVIVYTEKDIFKGILESFDAFTNICLIEAKRHQLINGKFNDEEYGLLLIHGSAIRYIGELDVDKEQIFESKFTEVEEETLKDELENEMEQALDRKAKKKQLLKEFNLLSIEQ